MKNIDCNLCGSNEYNLLIKTYDRGCNIDDTEFSLVKCKNCKLAYINPQPSINELIKYYPDTYGPYNLHRNTVMKPSPLIEFIRRHIWSRSAKADLSEVDRQKLTVLDFGCGDGIYMEQLRNNHPNWEIFGVDNSPIACQKARLKGFKVYEGDILNLNLPKNKYDEIYMGDVVEHVHDPKGVIEVLSETLKPGGKFKISTPNIRSITFYIFRSFWYALELPRHIQIFSPQTLSWLLLETGFVNITVTQNTGPKVLIRSLYYLFGKKDLRIHPITWRLLLPLSYIFAKLKYSDGMIVTAYKVK